MDPLSIVWSPPSAGTGRPRISGTVLARPDGRQACLVRQAFFGGENTGGTGCPRVETWLALEEPGVRSYGPMFVRRSWHRGMEDVCPWQLVPLGEVRMMAGAIADSYYPEALRLSGYTLDDLRPDAPATWPTTIWDRRVILPDDKRYPSGKRATVGAAVADALVRRNSVPDGEVWRLDAFILGVSPKADAAA